MSRFDYEVAEELIANSNVSFESLIMTLIIKRPPGYETYHWLRERYPDICREYWDRHSGINGFLRGESRAADDEYRERDLQNLVTDQKGIKIDERLQGFERSPKEVGKGLYQRRAQ